MFVVPFVIRIFGDSLTITDTP